MPQLHFDYETKCDLDLLKVGLDRYSSHPSCDVLMCGFALDGDEPELWDRTAKPRMPSHLADMLHDDDVELWAFNAQFERIISSRILDITPQMERWRCAMAMAYMQSFTGGLEDVGPQVGLKADQEKMKTGKKLIRQFSMPQRVTKNQPHLWRDRHTDPIDWAEFCEYCKQDVIAERSIKRKLQNYYIDDRDWEMYHVDQIINDRGIPIDMTFVENAIKLADLRKAELKKEMQDLTGLDNPNSVDQLLGWLRKRGYWFRDLQKATVTKVLAENEDEENPKFEALEGDAVAALKLRQQSARTSTRKYNAVKTRIGDDGRLRYALQYAGASRTMRWAGRGMQIQNLPSTPGVMEEDDGSDFILTAVTEAIRQGEKTELELWMKEPLDALSGLVRSCIRAPEGEQFLACDLSSIESCVIGWLSDCERLMNVFRDGLDPYKDFATDFYGVSYSEVTKVQRKKSKPAVLGCGYRIGGGELRAGKKTGLWGYAENMGIMLTQQEARQAVELWRSTYKEIPQAWYDYEDAAIKCVRTKRPITVRKIRFEFKRPYLMAWLPSGRPIYYKAPRIEKRTIKYKDKKTGEQKSFTKDSLTYMGKQQNGKKWVRLDTHGGKLIENFVQATARDILRDGLLACHHEGYDIRFHVHDEIVSIHRKGSNQHTLEGMRELMISSSPWAEGLPLGASGFEAEFYRKD